MKYVRKHILNILSGGFGIVSFLNSMVYIESFDYDNLVAATVMFIFMVICMCIEYNTSNIKE